MEFASKPVTEIACTVFGRNALVSGLICHVAALLTAAMAASDGGLFLKAVYPLSCLLMASGAYVEIRSTGSAPFGGWRWYASAAATLLPVIGPLIVLTLIYSSRSGRILLGLLPAIFRMRANLLLIFVLLLLLFLLFAVLSVQRDPYFKRRAPAAISYQNSE